MIRSIKERIVFDRYMSGVPVRDLADSHQMRYKKIEEIVKEGLKTLREDNLLPARLAEVTALSGVLSRIPES